MQLSAEQNVRSPAISAAELRYGTVGAMDVLLVGGDLLFREGLKRLFADTPVCVVGGVEDLQAVAALDLDRTPELLILLDPPAVGEDAGPIAEIRRRWPATRLVALARRNDAAALAAAVEAGIEGYLLTDMSPAALVQALNLVRLGENVFPTRLTMALVKPARTAEGATARRVNLTGREVDILQGLLDGHSNKMIANRLGTTDATVKAQLRHLLRKIGVENRTQAALWAREHGIGREGCRSAA